MRLLSTDPGEPGIIAIGQEAYGVFAFGQLATGVVAVGQLARGVVAIGQVAIGLVAIGQAAVGLYAGLAMVGLFGRGFPIPLVPKLPRPRELPPTTDLSQVRMGYGDGWVEAELQRTAEGAPALLMPGGAVADIKLSAKLVRPVQAELARYTTPKVIAHIRRVGDTLICDRLLHVPVPLTETAGFKPLMILRVAVLVAMAVGFWLVAWAPIAAMLET